MLIEYDKIFILYVYMFKCVCMLALIWQFQFFMLAQPLLYALFFLLCFATSFFFSCKSFHCLSVDCASLCIILNEIEIHFHIHFLSVETRLIVVALLY